MSKNFNEEYSDEIKQIAALAIAQEFQEQFSLGLNLAAQTFIDMCEEAFPGITDPDNTLTEEEIDQLLEHLKKDKTNDV